MTYLEYKHKIEFNEEQIIELVEYSKSKGMEFFASVWDKDSVDIMARHTKIAKIASASITDLELCKYAREKFPYLIISTGMSTEEEIKTCVEACNPDVIMHTNSTYPCPVEDLNMKYIQHLKQEYPNKETGYSGHEFGLLTTFLSLGLGATWIERHVTLDRNMWGSDHMASVEPTGLFKLVKGIRDSEKAMQYEPQPRLLFAGENSKRESLRLK
jgi:N-acetylneuraminate synthase